MLLAARHSTVFMLRAFLAVLKLRPMCKERRFWIVPIIAAVVACDLLSPPRSAFGVCFQPNPTVRCEFLNSDAVFVGTVLSTRVVPPGVRAEPSVPVGFTGIEGWVYVLSVQEMFRGPRVKKVSVFTTNDDARVFLADGVSYLLFANRSTDKKLTSEFGSQFEIDICGNWAFAFQATRAIQELRGMKIPQSAEVEGRVSLAGFPEKGPHVPPVEVMINGNGSSFRTSTDKEGFFHLSVPPGIYSATVRQIPHWNVTPFGDSFDNPEHFTARQGHCSGLQFIASPR